MPSNAVTVLPPLNGCIRERCRNRIPKISRPLLTAAVLMIATASDAQSPPEPAGSLTAARQEMMRETAAAAKYIAETFEGKRPYTGAEAREAAEIIRSGAGLHLTGLFQEAPDDPKARALPAIQSDWNAFEAMASDMERLAAGLSRAFAQSPDRLTDSMMMEKTTMVQGNPLLGSRNKAPNPGGGSLPAEHVFHQLLQTCTACHAKFRGPEK
jgi:cytochrome c556